MCQKDLQGLTAQAVIFFFFSLCAVCLYQYLYGSMNLLTPCARSTFEGWLKNPARVIFAPDVSPGLPPNCSILGLSLYM